LLKSWQIIAAITAFTALGFLHSFAGMQAAATTLLRSATAKTG
jgi:hypothetical protein